VDVGLQQSSHGFGAGRQDRVLEDQDAQEQHVALQFFEGLGGLGRVGD
jgi:hypothetical protein